MIMLNHNNKINAGVLTANLLLTQLSHCCNIHSNYYSIHSKSIEAIKNIYYYYIDI